jgi:hypothetical protein
MKHTIAYKMVGKTESGRWLIIGFNPKRPNDAPLIEMYLANSIDALTAFHSLQSATFQTVGAQ